MSVARVIDLLFTVAFLATAVYGVSELFGAIGDDRRNWLLPAYAVGVAYALFSALRAYSYPREARRALAARESAREDWLGS